MSFKRILRSEWQHLASHKLLIASLCAILFVPIMYGGFFLGSVWDPYGNTKNLPVAVVNQDEGATLNDTAINVGSDLVKNLKQNDDMGWKFVSADDADAGLSNGTYYMKVVIPRETSQNATTITETHPTKTIITYTTTPARNFIASLLTRQAAQTITSDVSSGVTKAYVSSILGNLDTLDSGLSEAARGAAQLADGSTSLQTGVEQYTAGVASLETGQASLTNGLANLSSGATSLKNGATQLNQSLPSSKQLQQLTQGVTLVNSGLSQLNSAVHTTDPALAAQQHTLETNAASLQTALAAYQTTTTSAQASIAALTTAASAGTPTVTVATQDVAATLQAVAASQDVAHKSAAVLTSLSAFSAGLAQQQASLQTNVASLSTGMDTLSPGLLAAIGGYEPIASGSAQLASGATQLSTGASSAYDGSRQLLNGTSRLDTASPQLTSGTSQLASGNATLAAKLTDASTQLALQPTGSETADQIVTPITSTGTREGHVPNYGYALSPYVLSLGLYIGALVFNVIYPVRRYFEKPKNAVAWWLSKMSVAAAVAIGQALVLDAIMILGLGLYPDHIGHFMLMSIVTSLTYMSVITLLVITLDNIGRFFAMLLLVLQLGAAGGVFPIMLSSAFFQAVNPFVPMTYSIYAYREAISSGLGMQTYWSNFGILVGISITANLLLIGFLYIHGMRHFRHEQIEE